MAAVAMLNSLPGKLLKKGNLVLTTSTISAAEITDSVTNPFEKFFHLRVS